MLTLSVNFEDIFLTSKIIMWELPPLLLLLSSSTNVTSSRYHQWIVFPSAVANCHSHCSLEYIHSTSYTKLLSRVWRFSIRPYSPVQLQALIETDRQLRNFSGSICILWEGDGAEQQQWHFEQIWDKNKNQYLLENVSGDSVMQFSSICPLPIKIILCECVKIYFF